MSENLNENVMEKNPPLSWWERVKNVFVNPDKAFADIAERPKALFPILVIVIGTILLGVLRLDAIKEVLRNQMMNNLGSNPMPPNAEQLINIQAYTGLIIGALSPVVMWLVKSGVMQGMSGFFGGDGKFKQAFSVVGYAYLPVLLGQVIIAIISMIIGELTIIFSPAVFLPDSMSTSFIYLLLSQFDIFVIWYEILAIIGISYAYKIDKKKAAILVLFTWFVWILIVCGLGVFGNKYVSGMM